MKNVARKRASLIVDIARLKKRHRRRKHMQAILVKLTTQQLKQELRHAK